MAAWAIAECASDGRPSPPRGAYTADAMAAAILGHRYDLQYAIYLFALHRLLKSRLPDYDYDRHLYKERHLVECFINKLKYYRRIFSRFDKLASRYLGFLYFAGALLWLR